VKGRETYYASLSYSGWAGSSGHDAPIIAYGKFFCLSFPFICNDLRIRNKDALLHSKGNWEELVTWCKSH